MNDQPLTGVRKRQQIRNVNQQVLIWVAIASAVVTVCIMLSINFIQGIVYQAKVISKKSETNSILETNVNSSIGQLRTNVDLLRTDPNLLALRIDPVADSALQVVIDALPMRNDETALGASLQKILPMSGVSIEQISVINSGAPAPGSGAGSTATNAPEPQQMVFTVTIGGTYDQIKTALADIERTIRPIVINNVSFQGTNSKLQVMINATTYYVPRVDWTIGEAPVPVSDDQPTDNTGNTTGGQQ